MSIEFKNITKKYKTKVAVDSISFSLSEGIYGLLGPNGAGKSTLMKMLVGNLKPTEGSILYEGNDISKMGKSYRGLIGYMPQQQEVYPYFTGRRFLIYMSALKGLEQKNINRHVEELADKVNLTEVLDKKIGSYSGGMRQRILIAQALLGDPKILIFDEPTAGLDPKERIRVRNLISENSHGKTVLIATHVVQDIEFISNEIVMLKQGELIAKGEAGKLVEEIKNYVWETECPIELANEFIKDKKVSNIMRVGEMAKIRIVSEEKPDKKAVNVSPDLEDYYLYVYED